MKFSINQSELNTALGVVLKGASTRTTLPILSGVFIETVGDEIVLQTTDLELSIKYTVPALVEEPGRTVVPAKILSDIVKNLPNTAVHLETTEDSLALFCDSSSFSLRMLNPDDFPGFPEVSPETTTQIPFDVFSTMVKGTASVVSKDQSRAILTGVYIQQSGDTLTMAATDTYRLAVYEKQIPNPTTTEFDAVIAGSFLTQIIALPKSTEPVELALSDNQIIVKYERTVFINRRIEGTFPNYRQLIPDTYETKITFPTSLFASAVKRVALMSDNNAAAKIDIDTNTNTAIISTMAQEIGNAQETVVCDAEGESTEIGFNFAFLTTGISMITGNEVVMELQGPRKPGILKTTGDENYLYLIMPVRIEG